MTPEQFCWFLRGALSNKKVVTEGEAEYIQKELNGVFAHHIDPSYPSEQQQTLQEAHNGGVITNVKLRC